MDGNTNRRSFLKSSGVAAVTAISIPNVEARTTGNTPSPGEYPVFHVASERQLKNDVAEVFNYPDKDSPCLLIKAGQAAPGGVGPNRDIVAFSAMCTHMGCLVAYDGATKTIKCPCHFSVFDPERAGQMVCGQATANLPQVLLRYDERSGHISAVGIDGLLYGRVNNML